MSYHSAVPSAPRSSSTSPYQMPPSPYGLGFYPNLGGTTPSPSSYPPLPQGPSPNNTSYHVPDHAYRGAHSPYSPPQPGMVYHPSTAMPGFPPARANFPYPPPAANPLYHPPGSTSPMYPSNNYRYPSPPTSTGYPPNTTPPMNPGFPPNTTPPTNPGFPPNTTPPTNPGFPPMPSNQPYSPPQSKLPHSHHVPGYNLPQQTSPEGYQYPNAPVTSGYPPMAPGEVLYPHSAHVPINEPPPPYALDPVDTTGGWLNHWNLEFGKFQIHWNLANSNFVCFSSSLEFQFVNSLRGICG